MIGPSVPGSNLKKRILRVELCAEGLKRIAESGENDFRRFLLAECLEAYAELDDTQNQRLQALLHTEAYREVEPLMKTTYERGIEQGIERGIERGIEQGIERGIEQGERRSALRLMEAKFGPLPAKVKQRFEALSLDTLARIQLDLLTVQTLEELRLDD